MENNTQLSTTPSTSTSVRIESLLEECIRRNASDLHIQYGLPPILRVDGVLTPIAGTTSLGEDVVRSLIFATLDEEQRKILIKDKEFDYSFAFGDIARFRVNAFYERGKLAAAFRLIPNQIKSIAHRLIGKEPGGTLIVPIQDEMAGFFAGAYEPVDREAIDHLIVNILR